LGADWVGENAATCSKAESHVLKPTKREGRDHGDRKTMSKWEKKASGPPGFSSRDCTSGE